MSAKYILDPKDHEANEYSLKFSNDTSYNFLSLSFLL